MNPSQPNKKQKSNGPEESFPGFISLVLFFFNGGSAFVVDKDMLIQTPLKDESC